MITKTQMLMHDYDWFCIINSHPVCVASAGSLIPDPINVDNYILNSMYRAYQLPRVCGFLLNTQYIMQNVVTKGFEYLTDTNSTYRETLRPSNILYPIGTPIEVQYYSEYFAKLAERGFWVFDRDIQYTDGDRFHLVAWPENPQKASTLYTKMYSSLCVSLETNFLDFKKPETLIEINLLDYFIEDNLRIENNNENR